MNTTPRVTVVIPVWNGADWLPACLRALAAQSFRDFLVIMVDNGSVDNSRELARAYPRVSVIKFERNRGFAAAVNAGIRQCSSEYVVLLNTDAQPRPDWLQHLVHAMDAGGPEVGCLASRMLSMGNPALVDNCGDILSWQGAAAKRGHGQPADFFGRSEEVFSACAGAALYRRSLLETLGGFDERFFAYLEDLDLGLRARMRGYRCLFVPEAEVLHQGHGSGISSARYVRLVTRNRLLLFLKNVPARLLLRHALSLIYGQWYFLVAYRRPLASLAGYCSFLACLPHVCRARRRTLKNIVVPLEALDRLLAKKMPEPPLRELAWNWLRRPRKKKK
ncbi:MAG: glycosyltransferase family 2 protein [Kiritimatiellae bacterium]|nr:glycosyltransferase family 2 protein [Kiritimatiellia bacterium]